MKKIFIIINFFTLGVHLIATFSSYLASIYFEHLSFKKILETIEKYRLTRCTQSDYIYIQPKLLDVIFVQLHLCIRSLSDCKDLFKKIIYAYRTALDVLSRYPHEF